MYIIPSPIHTPAQKVAAMHQNLLPTAIKEEEEEEED